MRRRLKILSVNRKPEQPDPKLKAALLAEAPGILRWAINGAIAWQRDGLKPTADVEAEVAEYFSAQDTFGRWVAECCDLNPTYEGTGPGALRKNFNAWADRNQEPRMNANDFHDAIKLYPGLKQVTVNGTNMVRGIRIRPEKPGEHYRGRYEPAERSDDPSEVSAATK
jgi:putative DNA primase/helicase